MNINNSKILVTGGCGLIGSTIIDLLLRDYSPGSIVIIDDLSRGTLANVDAALKDPRVQLLRQNICDTDAVNNAMQGVDAVVHLAALLHIVNPPPELRQKPNADVNAVLAAPELQDQLKRAR